PSVDKGGAVGFLVIEVSGHHPRSTHDDFAYRARGHQTILAANGDLVGPRPAHRSRLAAGRRDGIYRHGSRLAEAVAFQDRHTEDLFEPLAPRYGHRRGARSEKAQATAQR